MTSVLPFLMFEGRADEAMRFYTETIPSGEVLEVERYGPAGPGPEGSVLRATFRVGDQVVMCTDSFVKHGFTFTPSFSFFVDCASDAELERLFAALSEGGGVLMPPGDYGFSRRFAWVSDRFGVSWQINLP